MRELLTASASDYHAISDEVLTAYVKGAAYRFSRLSVLICTAHVMVNGDKRAARYQREIFLYYQVICRIQRERARRMIAEVDAKTQDEPYTHAVPDNY